MIHTSSAILELTENGTGMLELTLQQAQQPCIFKVKSNMHELVEAKPSHGIITTSPGKATVFVKYRGKVTELERVKLKIYWLTLPNLQLQLIKSSQLPQLYRKYRQELNEKDERNLALCVKYKLEGNDESVQEFRFSPSLSGKRESFKVINQTRKQPIYFMPQPEPPVPKTPNTASQTISPQHTAILSLIILAFLLGVTFGIKLIRLNPQFSMQSFWEY